MRNPLINRPLRYRYTFPFLFNLNEANFIDAVQSSPGMLRTSQVSTVSIKKQTSEISSDTIKNLFTSLKKLGFEKMKFLCEHKFIKSVTEEDIRNQITQSGLDNKEVKIDWLFDLNTEGVEKILKIIATLQSSKKIILDSYRDDNYREPAATLSLFTNSIPWSLCASYEIKMSGHNLVLTEDFRAVKTDTILLNTKEIPRLFEEYLYLISLTQICCHQTIQRDVLFLKIAQANNSDLVVSSKSELRYLLQAMKKSCEEKKFLKENSGFVIQVILACFEKRIIGFDRRTKNVVEEIYQMYRAECCPKKKVKNIDKLCPDINPSGQAGFSPDSICPAEDNRSPMLTTDAIGELFEKLTIDGRFNFARTTKLYYKEFENFCHQKNSKNNLEIVELRSKGLSEIQIVIEQLFTQRNFLARYVLGPNAMALVENGLLSIKEAEKNVFQFCENNENIDEAITAVERYRQDGLLSEADIEEMTPQNKLLLASELVQFAINSRQLKIEQVFKTGNLLDDKNCAHFESYSDEEKQDSFFTLLTFFENSKLTIKRYLELDTHQVRSITSSLFYEFIDKGGITVESALFLLKLMDTYKKSGWYGLKLMIASDNPEEEA